MAATPDPSIILQTFDLAIGYKQPRQSPLLVAENINLTLPAGELVCLIGPNGVGKSTLLRTLAGMQPPLSGQALLNGRNVHKLNARELARQLSVVLTERIDVGILSVYALAALGRHPHTNWTGILSGHDEAVVRWALEAVGVAELARRNVGELSDGERQKALIARALAQEPALMLLDEPTAYLDWPRRVEITQMLRRLTRDTGRTVLLSTHDLDLALRNADRLWLMARQAPIQVGAPEDLALNGALAATFQAEGVVFDTRTGSFVSQTQPGRVIVLSGQDEIGRIWTQRALERAGLTVGVTGEAEVQVAATSETGRFVWRLIQDGETRNYVSLYDLVADLRREQIDQKI